MRNVRDAGLSCELEVEALLATILGEVVAAVENRPWIHPRIPESKNEFFSQVQLEKPKSRKGVR